MENINDMGSGTFLKIAGQYGLIGAIAVALIAAFMGWLPSPMISRLAGTEFQQWQTNSLLRAICYEITAENRKATSINRCEPWKPREE